MTRVWSNPSRTPCFGVASKVSSFYAAFCTFLPMLDESLIVPKWLRFPPRVLAGTQLITGLRERPFRSRAVCGIRALGTSLKLCELLYHLNHLLRVWSLVVGAASPKPFHPDGIKMNALKYGP